MQKEQKPASVHDLVVNTLRKEIERLKEELREARETIKGYQERVAGLDA